MTPTPTQQRNSVSEGMALGLAGPGAPRPTVQQGHGRFSFHWRVGAWSYASRFPQVQTDLSHGSDGVRVMTRADEAKRTWVLF